MEQDKASLREVFSEAAEITDSAARTAFLNSVCQDDDALGTRVERLLLAGALLRDRTDSTERFSEKIGNRIGRYCLRERGGCGVVYRTELAEPVRRKVALKVIKLAMDT